MARRAARGARPEDKDPPRGMADQFETDALVIGAGVVGLAVAAALARDGRETLILEKNSGFGEESSSRNSEVIHAGLYYRPGSLKAQFCVDGRDRLYAFAERHGVGFARTGKLIVATEPGEEAALERIAARAEANGAGALEVLSGAEAKRMEPALRARLALWSPRTGVIDSHGLMLSLLGVAESGGAVLAVETPVLAADVDEGGVTVLTGGAAPARVRARLVVNAAGLWAPQIAALFGGRRPGGAPRPQMRLAKGNYFALSGCRAPFSRLIYPAPVDGGLGVHLTLDLSGAGRFGPDVEFLDSADPGEIDYAVDPRRADTFYEAIRRYWPELPDHALRPDYAGVRTKALIDGEADFRIEGPETHGAPGVIHLLGFESPALTSALAIGDHIARMADALTLAPAHV